MWPGHAAALLTELATSDAAAVLDQLAPDTAAMILRHTGDHLDGLLAGLSEQQHDAVAKVLRWPRETAGARMTPHALTVLSTTSAIHARQSIRAVWQQAETIVYVYILDEHDHLVGIVSFRELMLAPAPTRLSELMKTKLVTVDPRVDQEVAARLLIDHRLAALPVVHEEKLLGIISADDVSDIVAAEATEDAELQGGSAPLDIPYLRASPLLLWRRRIGWLLALFVAESLYTAACCVASRPSSTRWSPSPSSSPC